MPTADRAQLFADIDSMEPERFAAHLAPDATMWFGNADPIHGRDAIRDAWAGFCAGLAGVHHEIVEQWATDTATIVEARVTYTRQDGSRVTVPVVTIYRESGGSGGSGGGGGGGGEIDDYRIFIDLAPLAG